MSRTDTYPQPQVRRHLPAAKAKPVQAGSMWADLTKDPKTGHYVFKDVARVLTLLVGVSIVACAAWADYQAKRPISLEGAGILLTYALGVGIQKTYENQQNRRTADDNGNPLAVPGTSEPPGEPEIMPQANGTTSA
jgi:hypothetical protein